MKSLRNAALVCAGACALACSVVTDLSDVSAGPVGADAGVDSPVSVICNLSGDVALQPGCVASDTDGVFVSDKGNDASAGTKSAPLKSISAALAAAVTAKRPYVYACSGVYAGSVEVSSLVNIFGSFDCATWSPAPSGEPSTRIVASKPAYGVLITASHVSMARVAIAGLDAQLPGESSFGVVVAGAQDVNLISVSIEGGAGKDGSDGVPAPNYNKILSSDPLIAGNPASGATGALAHACTNCSDGKNSVGGFGGNALTFGGSPGGSGLPAVKYFGTGGAGGLSMGACSNGTVGADGLVGADADPKAATSYGGIVNGVWMPASGAAGKNGAVAQGGGGGGGTSGSILVGGGGGGCGGCGGGGGSGGSGGGASIGLLTTEVVVNNVAVASSVSVRLSLIKSLVSGAGGAGLSGQLGQSGGFVSKTMSPGCSGSAGGIGGIGGAGAGGAGGLSAGVAWHGQVAPVIDAFTASHITAGPVGKPGAGGRSGLEGIPAVSAQIVKLGP